MKLRRTNRDRLRLGALTIPAAVTIGAAVAFAYPFLRPPIALPEVIAALVIIISAALTAVVLQRAANRASRDAERLGVQSDLLSQQTAEIGLQTTALEQSVRGIRESEERARLLLAAVQDGVMIIDEKQAIVAWNESAERIFGLKSDEVKTLGAVLARGRVTREDGTPVALENLASQRAMATRKPQPPSIFRYEKIDGDTLWLSVRAHPLEITGGSRQLVAASFTDITPTRKAEGALIQVNEQLAQSQKMEAIGRLAGGVAHDFNNLLTVIVTYSELLKATLPEGTPQRNDVDEIDNAARRATALTRQLLAFSRRQILNPQDLDLTEVLRGMLGMLSRLLGEGIELVTREGVELSCAYADRGQVEQVIANLAINARDAMPGGGMMILETAEVQFESGYADHDGKVIPAGKYVTLCVSDTGAGMDEGTRSRIFDPFFTTKPPGKGTGLGLSTVIGIVSQSGGYISVYSSPRKGTTFKIYLPAIERRPSLNVKAKDPIPDLDELHSGRILLVEDDDAVRRATTRLLERIGYEVVAVDDPVVAIQELAARTRPFDLMLTDMVMPHMNGDQLAREVLAMYPQMRVVIMSGYSEEASNRSWKLPPNTIFVEKPVSRITLAKKLREAMQV